MMLVRGSRTTRAADRRGIAAVELAAVLPFLVFLVGVGVDFARVFYYSQTIANCARNGARYESDAYFSRESPYTLEEVTLRDAANLTADPKNLPKVTASYPDADTVKVTVTYKFKTVARFVGIPNEVELTRSVVMARTPANPDGS